MKDADEFLNLLMEKLEAGLKPTPQAQLITDHFGGSTRRSLVCQVRRAGAQAEMNALSITPTF